MSQVVVATPQPSNLPKMGQAMDKLLSHRDNLCTQFKLAVIYSYIRPTRARTLVNGNGATHTPVPVPGFSSDWADCTTAALVQYDAT